MLHMTPRTHSLLAGALAFVSGCAFDSGHDYGVQVTWLINGTAPDAATCKAMGVDRVRFTVTSSAKKRVLDAPCDSTESIWVNGNFEDYGAFTTTDSFDYGVTYKYEVAMIGNDGEVVDGVRYADTFQVFYGDELPWALAPLELFAPGGDIASLYASWTIDGKSADVALCEQLGASYVAIDVASSTDQDFVDYVEMARESCDTGEIVTSDPVLTYGQYLLRYVALGEGDEVLSEVYADGLYLVDTEGELQVAAADFETK